MRLKRSRHKIFKRTRIRTLIVWLSYSARCHHHPCLANAGDCLPSVNGLIKDREFNYKTEELLNVRTYLYVISWKFSSPPHYYPRACFCSFPLLLSLYSWQRLLD